MEVLLFCPTNELFGVTLQSIWGLEWKEPLHLLFTRDNPHPRGRENIIHGYMAGRAAFLAGDYDAMLTVESDMIIPPDALQRLAALEVDVAYSLYCWRDRPGWNATLGVREDGWPGQFLSDDPTAARAAWGKVIAVTGLGFGCTLIRRRVLEAVEFHLEDEEVPDSMLARAGNLQGWSQVCDMRVVCGHVKRPFWTLWPDPQAEHLYTRRRIWESESSE